jgi:hypothetical protein
LFEKNLNSVGRPDSDSSAKEVLILRPEATTQTWGCREDGPICFVAPPQTLPGLSFKAAIEVRFDSFDDRAQLG